MLSGKEARIIFLLCLDTVFFLLEIIIGYVSHSLALIADSFHMLNDIFSLFVALWAVNVAKNRNADASYTYGWKRAEIIGALINAVFLLALCLTILIEALQRLLDPPIITNPKLIMYVGFAGLVSNVVGIFLFHDHEHGPEEEQHSDDVEAMMPEDVVNNEDQPLVDKKHQHSGSLNMHGLLLHVIGDALGNFGVIFAALFIWQTQYSWRFYVDPLVSLLITVIIFSSALPLARKTSRILLQATPSNVSADEVRREILLVPGVVGLHDFHIWNLTESIYIASIHVRVDCEPGKFIPAAKKIREIFHDHGIHSATVQPEFIPNSKYGDGISENMQRRFSIIAGGGEGEQLPLHIDNDGGEYGSMPAFYSENPSRNSNANSNTNASGNRCVIYNNSKCDNIYQCSPKQT